MKTKLIMIPAVVGLFMMTSCKKKASEETMKSIADFETAWSELGQKATAWSQDLKMSVDNCTAHCAQVDSMATANAAMMNDEMKAKAEPMMTACKNDKTAFEAMWTEWTGFETSWTESTTAFAAWKEKVTKGEVTDEDAKKGLAEYQAKMEEAKAKVEGWATAYAAGKETCMKNMQACADAQKMMMEEMSKDPKKGAKKKA